MTAVETGLSLAVIPLAAGLAWAVTRRRPRRAIDGSLALVLGFEGAMAALFLAPGGDSPAEVMIGSLWFAAGPASVAVYAGLLAHLDTPIVAPLRRAGVQRALRILAVAATAAALTIGGARAFAGYDTESWETAGDIMSSLAAIGMSVFGLVVSALALKSSQRGTLAARRAGSYALAFGARDALLVTGITIGTIFVGSWPAPPDAPEWALAASQILPRLASLVFIVLLVVGVRATRLFDLDLRPRTLVRRGTLSALVLALLAGILVVLIDRLDVSARSASGLGVAAIVLALLPLHRLADRVATALVPREEAREEHLARRTERAHAWDLEETRTGHASRFAVERELGRGAFARALLVRDRVLDRRVVLKRPLAAASMDQRAAWLAEARAHASVRHPNVVTIHEIFVDEEGPALVLEHVEGGSLAEKIAADGALSPHHAARVMIDVLAGLEAIHARGLVHADVKPSNVLIDAGGQAKLADFGAARAELASWDGPGTRSFASPEQRAGRRLDARSDVYSAGRLLEHILGAAPEEDRTRDALRYEDALLRTTTGPSPLWDIVQRATASDPKRRYVSAAQMARALEP